jgi:uncharacterized secreted protein with C-terminal beta-propeller domain
MREIIHYKCYQYMSLIIFSLFIVSTAHSEMKIDSVYPNVCEIGKELAVTVSGSGFDEYTRVSISPDTGNRKDIISLTDTPGCAEDIAFIGSLAYVADDNAGIQIIDMSDPAEPEIIGHVDTPGQARSVEVKDDRAYVADGDNGVHIIDISTPRAPHIIDTIDTPGHARDIMVNGKICICGGRRQWSSNNSN